MKKIIIIFVLGIIALYGCRGGYATTGNTAFDCSKNPYRKYSKIPGFRDFQLSDYQTYKTDIDASRVQLFISGCFVFEEELLHEKEEGISGNGYLVSRETEEFNLIGFYQYTPVVPQAPILGYLITRATTANGETKLLAWSTQGYFVGLVFENEHGVQDIQKLDKFKDVHLKIVDQDQQIKNGKQTTAIPTLVGQ